MQSIKGTFNPAVYKMDNTIIAISLDEMLRIIVIGTNSTIQVFPFDNILIPHNSLYSLTNTWALNYKLYFDPIFFRVIIDFDIKTDKDSHTLVDWILLNEPGLPFFVSTLQDYFLKPYTK
jgi:hypothetical protein